jgi:riboflavin synthase
LGKLKEGSKVNLERAVTAHTRLGGHMVQGHVDTVAIIAETRPDGEAKVFRFKPNDPKAVRYIVEKGFICVDGASLTVTAVNDAEGWFEVMLVAYTQSKIVTASKEVGEEVNLEVDQVGKYVEKGVNAWFDGQTNEGLSRLVAKLVDERLKKE